jgi:hypothetical protein
MIKQFEQPIETKYFWKQMVFLNGNPTFTNPISIKCEIIAESEKQYKIRILNENPCIQKGREMWVKKKNVEYSLKQNEKKSREYDYTDAFWNK